MTSPSFPASDSNAGRTGPSFERRTTPLSPTQMAALRRMNARVDGWELAPGGYKGAGQDASRWWRTMRILEELGLVERRLWSDGVVITQSGRSTVKVADRWDAEMKK